MLATMNHLRIVTKTMADKNKTLVLSNFTLANVKTVKLTSN